MTDREPQQPRPTFDQILENAELPSPGPDYFAARRRLWLTPRVDVDPTPPTPSAARDKLEEILSHPNSAHSSEVWNNGLERVWKGLSSGGRLKNRLPMNLIIKIIYIAWLRDKTWPAGMQAPDSDDEMQEDGTTTTTKVPESQNPPEQPTPLPTITPSEVLETKAPRMLSHLTG